MLELLLWRLGLGLELEPLGQFDWGNSFGNESFLGAGFCGHCFVSVSSAAADTSCVYTDGRIL